MFNWKHLALVSLLIGTATMALADESPKAPTGVNLETLMKAELEGFEGAEVIVSRVTIPPHTELPKHWHPGEEFGYVLQGSCYLWQDGKEDILIQSGEALKVPLKQVHTAFTKDEAVTILVFRVHEARETRDVVDMVAAIKGDAEPRVNVRGLA